MNRAWLIAWATTRVGLNDRDALIRPSLTWLEHADESEGADLVHLIDLVSDKTALSDEIDFTVAGLVKRRGFAVPDLDDARWVVVRALVDGALNVEPYELARFLGKVGAVSEPDRDMLAGFMADVDYIDDGHLDAAIVKQQIANNFAELKPQLVNLARTRLAERPGRQWIIETMDDVR